MRLKRKNYLTVMTMIVAISLFGCKKAEKPSGIETTGKVAVIDMPTHVLSDVTSLDIARRQGVCRTLNVRLQNIALIQAKEWEAASDDLLAMSSLVNEMLNYYVVDTSTDTTLSMQTLAKDDIWQDKQGFRASRDVLADILQQQMSKGVGVEMPPYERIERIRTGCMGCHEKYTKVVNEE